MASSAQQRKQQQQKNNDENGYSSSSSSSNGSQPDTSAEVPVKVNPNSPPMAVLPLNSSSKLDQEPNPFEQSFSGAAAVVAQSSPNNSSSTTSSTAKDKDSKNQPETPNKPVLPPVASITSPAPHSLIGNGVLPKDVTNQFAWDSLRTGPLSPSMLAGPTKPNEMAYMVNGRQQQQQQAPTTYVQQQPGYAESNAQPYSNSPTMFVKQQNGHPHAHQQQQRASPRRQRQQSSNTDKDSTDGGESSSKAGTRRKAAAVADQDDDGKSSNSTNGKKKARTREKTAEDEEKRKNFLERNRIAALKCRQRKKQWLNNLQAKVEMLTNENEQLQVQAEAMREEIVNLKTLLLAHKDCPVAQNNGFTAANVQKSIPTVMPQQVVRHPAAGASSSVGGPVGAPPQAQAGGRPVYGQQPQQQGYAPADRPGAGAGGASSGAQPSTTSQPIHTSAPTTYTSSAPQQFQTPVTSMMGLSMQPQAAHHHHPAPQQQGMMAGGGGGGGGTSILRF